MAKNCYIEMAYSKYALYLHCVFHGIKFKVNKDWLS